MRNLKRAILLALSGASLAGAGPVQANADSVEVDVEGERWEVSVTDPPFSENRELLRGQEWWGDPELASKFVDAVFTDQHIEEPVEELVPVLFAYSEVTLSEVTLVEAKYWDGTAPESCAAEDVILRGSETSPWLCPSSEDEVLFGEEPFRFAIAERIERMMSLASVSESLESSSRAVGAALSTSTLHVHGAHGRPMSRYVDEGESTVWVLGDYGVRRHGDQDGNTGIAGVGAGHNFGLMQFNYSLGRTWTEEDLVQGGEVDTDTFFLMLEGIVPVHEEAGLFLTVGGFHQWGEADIRRGYLNSSGQRDFSTASPSMHGQGARVRMDWVDAWSASRVSLSPYADLSYSRIRMEGYEESGGDLPARFSSRSDSVTELRVGSELAMPIAESGFDFVATGNVTHRFDSDGVRTRGRMLNDPFTVNQFNIDGRDYDQTWVRAGVGVEGAVGPGDVSVMLNGTSRGEEEAGWLAASYSVTF
ncbi:autotransporter outer membrane beta-barrel domain-containing protein [Thioalkalivibrio sp. ALgr3]|uniref:autotransporter outer membrane beta-barrel domain-containing protein n=1 Tax=Thioalkalivibrio sp. ALgr3 TaxID=1239292 RepID=UPI001E5D0C7A|nr:autotransporter outer membrane beta-barrel domain-containing protein [Thioalkalivibrio sp. ALgr3]